MINFKKITFTANVAIRDNNFVNSLEFVKDVKDELENQLRQMYPMQMIVSDDCKLEIIGEV